MYQLKTAVLLPFVAALLLLITSCANFNSKQNKNATANLGKAENMSDLQINVERYTLENGLVVLLVNNGTLPIFSLQTFFNVGGRNELPGQTGATHFLEHLMFKGTKKFGPGEFDALVEGGGGNSNAYTTFDQTVYHVDAPTTSLERIIELEADRMSNLALEEKSFESERQVILEERKFRFDNSPDGQIYLTMMKKMFANTPYGGSVIGEVTDVNALTRSNVEQYFHQYYAPNNAVLVVAGRMDTQKVLTHIRRYYGPIRPSAEIESGKKQRDQSELYRPAGTPPAGEMHLWGTNTQMIFYHAFGGFPAGTKESMIVDLLASTLSAAQSSYLQQQYVLGKRPLMSKISAFHYGMKYNGLFVLAGEVANGASVKEVLAEIHKGYRQSCEKGLSARSLERSKNQFLKTYFDTMKTNNGLAALLGRGQSEYGDFAFYQKELETYQSITLEDAQKMCHRLLDSKNNMIFTIWQKNKK